MQQRTQKPTTKISKDSSIVLFSSTNTKIKTVNLTKVDHDCIETFIKNDLNNEYETFGEL